MRIVCVQPARDPMICGDGPVRVGCAQDDDVVLGGTGVAPHHASIVADARGLVLKVAPACQRVYVNARAVRERALLHYGDTLTFGGSKLLVTTDAPPPGAADAATTDVGGVTEPVAVRVVSGKASGQALAVQPELHLGADTRCFGELPFACRIAQTADGLVFESDSATPSVNGWHCRRAKLAPNDQITLGEHRLIIEAPGLQYAAYVASLPPPEPAAVNEPNTAEDSQHTGIWWLIAAAAVLAVIIALFLYFHG